MCAGMVTFRVGLSHRPSTAPKPTTVSNRKALYLRWLVSPRYLCILVATSCINVPASFDTFAALWIKQTLPAAATEAAAARMVGTIPARAPGHESDMGR